MTLNYTKVVQQLDSVVTFHHLCDGAAITGDTQQTLAPNTYGSASYQAAVEGYTYAGASPETFTVDGSGAPIEVTLTYPKDLVASQVTFHHVDADGNPLMADRTVEIAPSAEAYRSESYASAAPELSLIHI